MLSVTLFVLPTTFGFLIWNSYRKDKALRAEGGGFAPEGRMRWGDKPQES